MAQYRYDRLVSDDEFRQRVRQHRPSSLLPLVAAAGATYDRMKVDVLQARGAAQKFTPWGLAEVARTSVVFGTEFNRKAATDDDLLDCLCAYSALRDPELHRNTPGSAGRFFLRVSNEQLTFQQTPFAELARSAALFRQTTSPQVIGPLAKATWDEDLLGCSLERFVGVGQLVHVAALQNAGQFRSGWLGQPNFREIVNVIPADVIRRTVTEHFETDVDGFKSLQSAAPKLVGEARRFGYNPLVGRPLLRGIVDELSLIPVPALVLRKVSPIGLYYTGVQLWGNAFAQDAGWLLEAYAGRQLAQLPEAEVHPSIEYHEGKDRKDTVDWIVVFDDLVLLVEVKSVRPTESVRVGTEAAEIEAQRMLAKAIGQINTTANMIKERHSAVAHIPADRPIAGIVVTMEPFFVINSPLLRDWLPRADVPMSIAGIAELEHFVNLDDSPSEVLLKGLTDAETLGWSLGGLLAGRPSHRNAILDEAFATYPWRDAQPAS